MFESTRDAFVYKYQDISSKSIEYISIEDLAICEWKDAVIQNTATTTNNKSNLTLPKRPLYNANKKNKGKVHLNGINNLVKRKSSCTLEYGPPRSIFDEVQLEEGSKRNRNKK